MQGSARVNQGSNCLKMPYGHQIWWGKPLTKASCIAEVKGHAGVSQGQPEVKFFRNALWPPNLAGRTPDQSVMHRWVKGHAGVSWGQPEGNCLEMRKAIKCSQCYRALCSCRCSSINNVLDNFIGNDVNTLDYDITSSEVIKAALHLYKGEVPGVDGIRNEMLKEGTSVLAPSLAALFNLIFKQGLFPSAWRLSTLTVFYLKKSYRNITLSSNLCKSLCLVLYNRLKSFTDDDAFIAINQLNQF